MIDIEEWRQVPLDERLAMLAERSDDPLLREAIAEVLRRFSNAAVQQLRTRITELESENRRLERQVHAPTPY